LFSGREVHERPRAELSASARAGNFATGMRMALSSGSSFSAWSTCSCWTAMTLERSIPPCSARRDLSVTWRRVRDGPFSGPCRGPSGRRGRPFPRGPRSLIARGSERARGASGSPNARRPAAQRGAGDLSIAERPADDSYGRFRSPPGISSGSMSPWWRHPTVRSQVRGRVTGIGLTFAWCTTGVLRHPSNHRPDDAGSTRSPLQTRRAWRREFRRT